MTLTNMKAMTVTLLAVGLWCVGGCQPVRYVLDAKTEWVSGVRMTPYTEYSYFKVDATGSKTILWHERRMEAYARHWVSETGALWVMTKPFIGPGGAGGVWYGDPSGGEAGQWPRYGLSSLVDDDHEAKGLTGRTVTLRTGIADELIVSNPRGKEARLIAFKPASGLPVQHVQFTREPSQTADSPGILEQTLRDLSYKTPSIRQVGWSPGTYEMEAARTTPGGPPRFWLLSVNNPESVRKGLEGTIAFEHMWASKPTLLKYTPSGYLVAFVFDDTKSPGTAVLSVFDHSTKNYTADLLQLGGFASSREARRSIDLDRGVSWSCPSSSWMTLQDRYDILYGRGHETLDFFDRSGKRYVLDISTADNRKSTYSFRVQTGLQARKPLSFQDEATPVVWQRTASSPHGTFHVSASKRAYSKCYAGWTDDPVFILLTADLPDNGRTTRVEVWSSTEYGDVYPAVSDSGRVFLLSLNGASGKASLGQRDHATIQIGGPGAQGIGGLELLGQNTWVDTGGSYSTCAEAVRGIKWDQMRIVSRGILSTRNYDGLPLPAWSIEEFTIPQDNGRTIHEAIVGDKLAPKRILPDGKKVLDLPEG